MHIYLDTDISILMVDKNDFISFLFLFFCDIVYITEIVLIFDSCIFLQVYYCIFLYHINITY